MFVKKRAREHDRCKNDKVADGRYGHKWVFVQNIHSNMDVLVNKNEHLSGRTSCSTFSSR